MKLKHPSTAMYQWLDLRDHATGRWYLGARYLGTRDWVMERSLGNWSSVLLKEIAVDGVFFGLPVHK